MRVEPRPGYGRRLQGEVRPLVTSLNCSFYVYATRKLLREVVVERNFYCFITITSTTNHLP